MWYFLGMRLTNPGSAGLPGLAEIRKEKKNPTALEREEANGKDSKMMNECLFSENTGLQNLFLLWPACSFLASCPLSIGH